MSGRSPRCQASSKAATTFSRGAASAPDGIEGSGCSFDMPELSGREPREARAVRTAPASGCGNTIWGSEQYGVPSTEYRGMRYGGPGSSMVYSVLVIRYSVLGT